MLLVGGADTTHGNCGVIEAKRNATNLALSHVMLIYLHGDPSSHCWFNHSQILIINSPQIPTVTYNIQRLRFPVMAIDI